MQSPLEQIPPQLYLRVKRLQQYSDPVEPVRWRRAVSGYDAGQWYGAYTDEEGGEVQMDRYLLTRLGVLLLQSGMNSETPKGDKYSEVYDSREPIITFQAMQPLIEILHFIVE